MKVLSFFAYNNSHLFQELKRPETNLAEALELRVDRFEGGLDFARLKKHCPKTVIFTCRQGTLEENRRRELYAQALEGGVQYIDLDFEDYSKFSDLIQERPQNLILSYHNYGGCEFPMELEDRFFSTKAGIHKIALQVNDSYEGFLCLEKIKKLSQRTSKLAFVFMGEAGEWSRTAYKGLGGYLSFFCFDGEYTAPGQVSLNQYHHEILRSSSKDSDVYGIIGDPIAHSKSPYFHNHFFSKFKISASYHRFLTRDLKNFFQFLPEEVKGLSVTTPYKDQLAPYLCELDPSAAASGVVNTVKRTSSGLKGYNTDGAAVVEALGRQFPEWQDCRQIVVLGAGGVARSVLSALYPFRQKVKVRNRTDEKAYALAEKFQVEFMPFKGSLDLSDTVLIQATSAGMGENRQIPVPPMFLTPTTLIVESIYHPRHTPLVEVGLDLGCRVMTGDVMFYYQALGQQKIWFDGRSLEIGDAIELMRLSEMTQDDLQQDEESQDFKDSYDG